MGFGLLDDPPLFVVYVLGECCFGELDYIVYLCSICRNIREICIMLEKKHYLCAEIHLNKYRRIHTNNQIINFYEKHYKETICIGCIGCSCCN